MRLTPAAAGRLIDTGEVTVRLSDGTLVEAEVDPSGVITIVADLPPKTPVTVAYEPQDPMRIYPRPRREAQWKRELRRRR